MSFNKKNETNNMSKSQSLNYNIDNYKLNREQTVKKNKIINIRIYQNYSSNKNSNAFYPYSNDFFDINNLQKRKTNEIGTQTDTENGKNKIMPIDNNYIKNSDYLYRSLSQEKNYLNKISLNSENNYSRRTFSCKNDYKIYQYNNKSSKRRKENKKMAKNKSYNLNNKKSNLNNKKQNKNKNNYKSNCNELFEIVHNDNKKEKLTKSINYNYNYNKKEKNYRNEKNKIAKKYSLFNLKNDNKYMIINDGNYDSNYKENNKLSINNIYLNGKSEKNNNKYIKRNSLNKNDKQLNNENNVFYNNYFKTYKCKKQKKYENMESFNKKIYLDENRKLFNRFNNGIITPDIKRIKTFNELSIVNCYDFYINNTNQNKKELVNDDKYLNNNININNLNNHINSNFYNQLIKNINDNVNQYLSKYISKSNKMNNDIKDNKNKTPIINQITKESIEILSPKSPKNENKIKLINDKKVNLIKTESKILKSKNKIKETSTPTPKNRDKNKNLIYKKFINSNKKIKENNRNSIKYDSFLQDMTKEDGKDILFEDLLKTFSDISDNGNIIGDEKAFFNNSKIPKIEEFKFIQKNKSPERNTINNMIINQNQNMTTSRSKNTSQKIDKPNLKNIFDKLHTKIKANKIDYNYEYNFLKKLANKRKEKISKDNKIYEKYEKFMRDKKLINNNNNKQYIYKNNNNNEIKKIINKEKMYNFIFNEKINSLPYNKELNIDIKENESNGINNINVNNIINKLNTEIKTCSTIKLYKNYNNKNKINSNDIKYKSRKNKSYKDSYSKYYLNKLEIENKYLIPQLNKKIVDYYY